MGRQTMISIHPHFEDFDGGRVMVAKCSKAASAIFVKDGETDRMGPSTEELGASQPKNTSSIDLSCD